MLNFMFTFLQQQSFLWPLYKSSHGQSTKNIPYESKRKWARIGRPDLETATGEISSSVLNQTLRILLPVLPAQEMTTDASLETELSLTRRN